MLHVLIDKNFNFLYQERVALFEQVNPGGSILTEPSSAKRNITRIIITEKSCWYQIYSIFQIKIEK